MKKVLLLFLTVALLAVSITSSAQKQYLTDEAHLLNDEQNKLIQSYLNGASERLGVDVAVATTSTGYSIDSFTEQYYLKKGYSSDGIILLIAYREYDRELSVRIFGECRNYFTDENTDMFLDKIQKSAKEGDFEETFMLFADMSENYIEAGREGKIVKEPFNLWVALAASLAIGFLIALIAVLVMKSKLKSVRFKTYAYEYTKPGSFVLNEKRDIYLFSTVTRRAKPQSNDNHGSSRGGASSGGSRSF